MPPPRALTIDLEGKRVKVYRNLKYKGLFSVQFGGLVVAHLATVHLMAVEFKVTETGRQRVIAQHTRNVHAYAVGIFRAAQQPGACEAISYNPYTAGHFFRMEGLAPIYSTQALLLLDGKAYASPAPLPSLFAC